MGAALRRRLSRLPFIAGRTALESAPGRLAVKLLRGSAPRPGTLLVLRLDRIGDYVLFRNFLSELRVSERYARHHITLCGNVLWRDLAEALDSGVVDRFEWIDPVAFQLSLAARWDIVCRLSALGAETILQPRHSREAALEDALVAFLRAGTAIGSAGDTHNIDPRHKAVGDRLYTTLIAPAPGAVFEFEINRSFFEGLLEQNLSHLVPRIDREALRPVARHPRPYALLVPGGSEPRHRWPPQRFADVLDFLLASTPLDVLICGGPDDRPIASRILAGRKSERIEDLTGRTTLRELAALVAFARVLVSNDTGAVHIGAATGTTTVCVANGTLYGRFTEYPPHLSRCVTTIYPSDVERLRAEPDVLIEKYRHGSSEDIESIPSGRVISTLQALL